MKLPLLVSVSLFLLVGCRNEKTEDTVDTGTITVDIIDLDGDGFEANEDCDDLDPAVFPGADEYCDEIDNDCDTEVDEDDALDVSVWYQDSDEDGYGSQFVSYSSCYEPEGYVADNTDCNDSSSATYPGADEYCDGVDTDCDNTVDEDDALDVLTLYADSDLDGYGDQSVSNETCYISGGWVSDSSDCDDSSSSTYPGADEYCDGVDTDCDNTFDEDDALDVSTWYADSDLDGYGDPLITYDTCYISAGWVANADDCDDTSASDIDNDGLQDCEDDDIDGDSLRNSWDAAPNDSTVVRGPNQGLGGDGALTISTTVTWSDWAELLGGATTGDSSLSVDDSSPFAVGDEVVVVSQQGSDAGEYTTCFITGIAGTTLSIEPVLQGSFSSSSTVRVQRIPHFTDFEITTSGVLLATTWSNSGTGLIFLRATGDVSISGDIDTSASGFTGGAGVYGNSYDPYQGESWGGPGSAGDTTANNGGGGAYPRRGDNADSGGGGGFGTVGSSGTSYSGTSVTSGGTAYGTASLAELHLGSGGGGGSPDTESDGSHTDNYSGDGGPGGGAVLIFSGGTIEVSGLVAADGEDGDDAYSPSHSAGEDGAGGAGSGGLVYLASPYITITGSVSALGGTGGDSSSYNISTPYGGALGGDGGDGRVRLDGSVTGSSTPAAGYTDLWSE